MFYDEHNGVWRTADDYVKAGNYISIPTNLILLTKDNITAEQTKTQPSCESDKT